MSGAKIVKSLLAQNGPMTTKAIATFIPKFEQELVSKSHLKTRILTQLKNSNILEKKVHREPDSLKEGVAPSEKNKAEVFVWKFVNPETEAKYKDIKL